MNPNKTVEDAFRRVHEARREWNYDATDDNLLALRTLLEVWTRNVNDELVKRNPHYKKIRK